MTIEHRDTFSLGWSLVRLYGFNTFGTERKLEYEMELVAIHELLNSLGLGNLKSLLKPTPEEDDLHRGITGHLFDEYVVISKAIGRALQGGRSGDVYCSYFLGWHLQALTAFLSNPVSDNEQKAASNMQWIRDECQRIRYFMGNGPQLPNDLVEKLDNVIARAETTTNRSSEAYKIIREIGALYDDLLRAFEQSPALQTSLTHPRQKSTEGIIRILFLAADPADATRLRLGEEFREINEQLRLSEHEEKFNMLLPYLSLRPRDISRALLEETPQIVHFSGHGTSEGALCFEDESGRAHFVQPEALAALFGQFAGKINCVILNACYAENQARAIAKYIDYVIGMRQEISDKAAIAFSVGFYQALGAGKTIEEAFEFGRIQIMLQGVSEHLVPVLIRKDKIIGCPTRACT